MASSQWSDLDPSKVTITPATTLKPLPKPEDLDNAWGKVFTDHMLLCEHDPVAGWGAPRIVPYGPLSLDPASACFQYAPTAFEGTKAFLSPSGTPRLFRPDMNMARLARSCARVALPPFDGAALLELIKIMVSLERRWIPAGKGYSLYVRPTMMGTRVGLGVAASETALLYIILCPTGKYFPKDRTTTSLLASNDTIRSWPGGTGGHKLALNYSPCFAPQRIAASKGYEQNLWLLGDDQHVTEAGQMNFFAVFKKPDGVLEVTTNPLDGTILPGVTRDSVLKLVEAESKSLLPGTVLRAVERTITIKELVESSELVEMFGAGTAAVIAPISRVGYDGKDVLREEGVVSRALWKRITEIQMGEVEHPWSVQCETTVPGLSIS
ncbi:branched-chain amino acid aminotransferase II [Exidia glandulosa HHB12029]|uniref:Branched-chain-amino-acid aminotransferase n=1 Tax=Exidia glandulosa HHB12029 TaxID=1314781 RepID=A0A166BR65_EXIGL|nr:branched-chain amino acid aminotransferase II [Exidia glandulosa HHB12029]